MPSPDLAKLIHERLKFRQQTIAAAESCTGGAFTAELVKLSGASDILKGSVIAYSNNSKTDLLDVKKSTLDSSGAVSQEVAIQMAKGAKVKFASTWSVGITGIAGPTGGSKEKPNGTVCIAVVGPGFEYSEINLFTGNREAVIESTVKRTMQLVLEHTH